MSLKNLNPRFSLLLLFILAGGMLRILGEGQVTPYSNVTPIGAMALFAGAYFNSSWKSYVFPLLTLFISDVIVQQVFYPEFAQGQLLYQGWAWTYLGFAAMVLAGQLIIKKVNIGNIVIAAAVAAVAHWLITDFGVWLGGCTDPSTGQLYTKDANGLLRCYAMAVPYMKYMFIGNVVYGAIFFGGFELIGSRIYEVRSMK
ncbi:DUF6580 family putative transport protein [Chitinophaga japonensis]|uniref:Uncharacterized protein n=1 Tax=Chitinophaga japonensis TaxID=104662 RepID=A0A562TF11_CHIJA|nr:DUF6580 family putative transport protein [Chitinophaga japonensis]TWI92102.1 hypothetical protein LX66_1485 [Chitinophaga japonensis]